MTHVKRKKKKGLIAAFLAVIDLPANYRKLQRVMPEDLFYPPGFRFVTIVDADARRVIIRKTAWKMLLSRTKSYDPDWSAKAIEALTEAIMDDYKTLGFLRDLIGNDVVNDHKWLIAERSGRNVWKDERWLRKNVACWERLDKLIGKGVYCFHEDSQKQYREQTLAAMHWLQNEFLKKDVP